MYSYKGGLCMTPVVKGYRIDGDLEVDVVALQDKGVGSQDMYVLSLDKSRTDKIAEDTGITGIDIEKENNPDRVALKEKLKAIGVDDNTVATFKKDMDEDKVYLIVTDSRVKGLL